MGIASWQSGVERTKPLDWKMGIADCRLEEKEQMRNAL